MNIIKGMIPTFDLAAEPSGKVVVDKEIGRYLGHVSTVLLSDQNTIIAVYVLGHGRGQAVMKKSTDGGLSWSQRLAVPKSFSTLLQVPVIYRLKDIEGIERLVIFTGHYPIRMSISEDNGLTWSELVPIGEFGGNVAMSSLIELDSGRYLGFFHDDGRFIEQDKKDLKYQLYESECGSLRKVELYQSIHIDGLGWSAPMLDQQTAYHDCTSWSAPKLIYESYSGKKSSDSISKIYKTISNDGGKTWSKPSLVVWHNAAYLAEAGVLRSPDQKQICILLRENTRKYHSFVSYSNDEGETWCEPYQVSAELTGDRHTIRYSHDGRVVITFRDTCVNSPTHGDWVVWVGTYDDVICGRTGQYRIRLMKNHYQDDCGYAGLELLPDGTFVATSYGHWVFNEAPFIMSVRFQLKDLEEKAMIC